MGLISSFRKNLKLSKLMKRLGGTSRRGFSIEDVLRDARHAEIAEEELYELVLSDHDLQRIMDKYGATRATLKEAYSNLRLHGAGQWVGGAYVPVAAIATIPTLDFILHETKDSKYDEYNKWLKISSQLVTYFQSGKVGRVE